MVIPCLCVGLGLGRHTRSQDLPKGDLICEKLTPGNFFFQSRVVHDGLQGGQQISGGGLESLPGHFYYLFHKRDCMKALICFTSG